MLLHAYIHIHISVNGNLHTYPWQNQMNKLEYFKLAISQILATLFRFNEEKSEQLAFSFFLKG